METLIAQSLRIHCDHTLYADGSIGAEASMAEWEADCIAKIDATLNYKFQDIVQIEMTIDNTKFPTKILLTGLIKDIRVNYPCNLQIEVVSNYHSAIKPKLEEFELQKV